jgi:hyperosmotically inducible protein
MTRSTFGIALGLAVWLAAATPALAATAPDAWITTRVKMGLLASEAGPLTAMRDIDVDTVDGRVTLHGTVASAEAKQDAERVARGVSGVREVRNRLTVDPSRATGATAEVSDETLRERVRAALAADEALRDSRIEVRSVEQGVVTLTGEARTLSDARRALEDAAGVAGVRRVENRIQSPEQLGEDEVWSEKVQDRAAAAQSAARDMWITTAAKARLVANPETPAFDINVDTRDGVVTLFGTVGSKEAREQAEAEVRKIEGVREVENDLQVVEPAEAESAARTDEQLGEAIEQRLEASERLGEADFDVEVENGVARLSGSVPTQGDKLAALTVARSTQGVRRVIDDLRVEPPVGAPPAERAP